MKKTVLLVAALSIVAPLANPVSAQATATTAPVVADLMKDVGEVSQKMIALAKAIPEDKYAWRPAAGVRSVGEVFQHVAADNYLLPIPQGVAADPATGIPDFSYNAALTRTTSAVAMSPERGQPSMQET